MTIRKLEILILFAANLRRIRMEKGLSLRALAALWVKIDNADLSRYEHAEKNITLGTLEEIAKALEVLVVELLLPPDYEIRKKE